MNFIELVLSADNLLKRMKTNTYEFPGVVSRPEFIMLQELVVDILNEGLNVLSNIVIDGNPYPPYDLRAMEVLSSSVTLNWKPGVFGTDSQHIDRSDNGGKTWNNISGSLDGLADTFVDNTVLPNTAYQYRAQSHIRLALPKRKKVIWRLSDYLSVPYPEDIVIDYSDIVVLPFTYRGRIESVGLYLENTGEDPSNPLTLTCDMKVNAGGNSIFSSPPVITKDSPDRYLSMGAIRKSRSWFNQGDILILSLDITRTAPVDEMAGAVLIIDIMEGEDKDSQYSNVIEVVTPSA